MAIAKNSTNGIRKYDAFPSIRWIENELLRMASG